MNEPVELDEAARDLIAAGRENVGLHPFVAERLRRAVDRGLSGFVPPPRSRHRSVPVVVALGAALLGGALYANKQARSGRESKAASKPEPPAKAAPRTASTAPPMSAPGPSTEPTAIAPATPASEPMPTGGRVERPPFSRSQHLSAEIELLARVNAAVNAGDGSRALELLGEYDRKFRPGILAEERAAASVLSLCAAGRTSEARAAAERFAGTWQRSPLLGRIAGSCAGTP